MKSFLELYGGKIIGLLVSVLLGFCGWAFLESKSEIAKNGTRLEEIYYILDKKIKDIETIQTNGAIKVLQMFNDLDVRVVRIEEENKHLNYVIEKEKRK